MTCSTWRLYPKLFQSCYNENSRCPIAFWSITIVNEWSNILITFNYTRLLNSLSASVFLHGSTFEPSFLHVGHLEFDPAQRLSLHPQKDGTQALRSVAVSSYVSVWNNCTPLRAVVMTMMGHGINRSTVSGFWVWLPHMLKSVALSRTERVPLNSCFPGWLTSLLSLWLYPN